MNQGNRKWEKRPQLYRGRYFYLKSISQIGLFIAAVLTVVAVLLYFQKSDVLFVRKVTVHGDLKHLTKNQVIQLSEISPSDKLFNVNFQSVSLRLLKHPWIQSATLRREFPDTVQIHIQEREPVAILNLGDFYFVDKTAKVFKKMTKETSVDLPVFSGFEKTFVQKYPRLAKVQLEEALEFFKLIAESKFFEQNEISEINVDPVYGYTVFTKEGALEVFFGRTEIKKKQMKLEKFAESQHFDKRVVLRIDLDAKGKVVVRNLSSL